MSTANMQTALRVRHHDTVYEPYFGDSEIDFDDDRDDDQYPLDVLEAREAGVLLDDPEDFA
jgi:hypothetical protein